MQESTEQTFQVQQLLVYPKYNRSVRYDADIALLKLNESADMTDFVQPICLGKLPPGRRGRELCYITGWGDTENGPYYNGNLNQAQLPALSDKKCSRIYGERGVKLTKNMFCAGETGDPPVPDACSADSGGPLACRYKNRWILYGVTSLGLNGPDRLYSIQSQLPPAFVMPLKEIIADEENVREEQETRQLRCGNGPGIYTDVAKFKKWIERTIRTN
ncbi:plasma kallikrein-like [Lingula anatina]|uniref:Plasma kallikrein-like n=1 Tax=Lingula anatina TaxID=7574 RepID=A0A1S3KCX3_LINAN|nr:plasma kallikrein-like [Lingula anatina]|eukprot:XP_013420483.1 plasma kallikrein-like [Lingula anatina]